MISPFTADNGINYTFIMKVMYGFCLLTFIPLIFSTIVMWSDIKGRQEYGKRSKHLMISLLLIVLAGVCQLGLYLFNDLFDQQMYLILFYIVNVLYFSSFFMLEYSIHSQRIRKSHLYQDFIHAVKKIVILFVIVVLYCIGALLFYLGTSVFKIIGEIKDPTNFLSVMVPLVYFGSFFAMIVFNNMIIFRLQDGIIRQRKYTFNTLFFINIVFFIIIAFLSGLLATYGFIIFSLFTIANIIYIIRLYKGYFFYRTDHLRLSLISHEKMQQDRNALLRKIMKSRAEEDVKILRAVIEQELKKTRTAFPALGYGITGMMYYTIAGSILKIENKELIIGHCIPIHEVREIKHMNEQQIIDKILKRSFDMNRIANSAITELHDPAEKAIKTIFETKNKFLYKKIPEYYLGLQRFIGIFPVMDDEKLSGLLVVFKDNSKLLFPEEEKIITDLIDNVKIIRSIMEGKHIQHERNRLQGEIDLARKIQLSILPREINIKGYDCACFIETATEVGGDVYDFINTKHGNFLGIGDVSGHGLPAGIMALIQMAAFESSVYTSEILKKEIKPNEVYNVVNKVLYNINKNRIGSDKYMTQNYLVENHEKIMHAGAHEIALHYFEKEEKVYELKGFAKRTAFLGISPNINSEESLGSFTVSRGDVLLLYSDGVIEAKNHYSKQFGVQRLKETLQAAARLSAKEIIDRIMAALYEFAKDGDLKRHNGVYADDVSILVFKKL